MNEFLDLPLHGLKDNQRGGSIHVASSRLFTTERDGYFAICPSPRPTREMEWMSHIVLICEIREICG